MEVAVGVEQAAPPQPPSTRRGGVRASKVAAAPPPRPCSEALEPSAAGSQPERAPCGCSADESRDQLQQPPRPRSLEPSGRRRAGWVLPASGEPLCEAAPIECPANFQKLLQIKGRGDRHRAGPQSGRVWPEGDAGRAHQPVTRNFPAKPPRRTALCLLPSTAILASRFAGELGSE